MQHAQITAGLREEKGRKTNILRLEGKVPAIMYGFEVKVPVSVTVDRNAFNKIYAKAGESMVIDLEIDGQTHPVLISDTQRNVLTDFFSHVDFRRVDMKRKISAKIPLKLVGEAPAVKTLGGTLVQSLEEVEVLSLPDALVHEIEVDIAALVTFDDMIRVKNVKLPEGIEVKTWAEQTVATVQPPRSEAEMAALDSAVDSDVSKVEVLTEKKEEPGAEGAASPDAKAEKKTDKK